MDTMPTKTVKSLLRVVAEQGYPVERALQIMGLNFNPLDDTIQHPEAIASTSYSKLYRLLMEILQDEAFGLGQEFRSPPGTFRMLCLFVIHCPNLEQALLRAREFFNYCDRYRNIEWPEQVPPLLPLDDGSVLCLFQRPPRDELQLTAIGQANVLLMMYRFCSWLIGKQLPLQSVHLRGSKPRIPTRYGELFDSPVQFDQRYTGLVVKPNVLQHPIVQTEDSLRDFLRQTPHQLVKKNRPGQVDTLSHQIEQLLTQYATQKLPNAEQLAQQLNMSPRTLHRKLNAEGTSFQQLKDDFRRELAIHYVGRPELTFDAIAALMGFQDNSAFYRSFKKWTGSSPGVFRAELLETRA